MKPDISYIYEYHGNQRIHQVGFLKMQSQGIHLFMDLRIRSHQIFPETTWKMYAFYMEDTAAILYDIGEIQGRKQILESKSLYPLAEIPEKFLPGKMDGIWIEQVNACHIEKTFSPVFIAVPANHFLVNLDTANCQFWQDPDTMNNTPLLDANPSMIAASTATEYPAGHYKIQRQDLTLLPRKEWYLANNSFLLHGYYNYHHLLLVKEEHFLLLGVPGIYDQREARAAELFGFPEFSPKYVKHMALTEDEQNLHFEFGHYLRKIRK